jgi:hypothetical protein
VRTGWLLESARNRTGGGTLERRFTRLSRDDQDNTSPSRPPRPTDNLAAAVTVTLSCMTGSELVPPNIQAMIDAEIRRHPGRVVRMLDYLVVERDFYDSRRTPAGHAGPLELARGVRIESLPAELANRLFLATTLRGEDWLPRGTPEAVHALVVDTWAEDQPSPTDPTKVWDAERLWPAVQLSRLVRDNATSTEHGARVEIFADGSERIVPFGGYESFTVYRLYPDRAGWLDVDEALQLRALLTAFWNGPDLPLRIRRALRRTDAITSERYLEDAMPLVVGAFESLLKIGRDYARAQFSQRVPQLAAEVGVTLTTPECKEVYDDRSALVHGDWVDLSKPHDLNEFGRKFNSLQEALRRTVRRAIEDRTFAATFDDDARITARWPTVVTKRGKTQKTI